MRIVSNTKLVKRNNRIAQILFFFSLGVLILGFFLTNQQLFGIQASSPELQSLSVLIPSVVLPIGLISTLFSVRMTNLWVRRPRPEDTIQENLKGLSNRSVLYNYYHLPARHVLICPQGVFAIVTRFQDGRYTVTGSKWRTHRSALSRFLSIFRLDGIGDPMMDAGRAAQRVQKQLAPIAPDVQVQPLILFIDPRARFEAINPSVPVLYADEKQKPNLRDYLRTLKGDVEEEPVPEKGKKKGQPKKKQEPKVTFPLSQSQIDAFEQATIPG
jgi:hypothetical protein